MRTIIIFLIHFLDIDYRAMQFKFGRKYLGGTFYLIKAQLPIGAFWSDVKIESCRSQIIKTETY